MTTIIIGDWIESAAREISHCPSTYAADHETLRTTPGRYPARLDFVGGYTVPMPYWLLVKIDAVRVDGRLYNGFGGVNYSSVELKKGEATPYHVQMYDYQIPELVESGRLVLRPGFEWLARGRAFKQPEAPKTWDDVAALRAAEEICA